uniref:Uncharacterized protein n=1 Tax=Engystomops pustulosus TaxID=76066 RepID=A0AAV6YWQ8_ENGPU|nr:hypothetical protein GDO81_020936 [Engystomops pustulosus]
MQREQGEATPTSTRYRHPWTPVTLDLCVLCMTQCNPEQLLILHYRVNISRLNFKVKTRSKRNSTPASRQLIQRVRDTDQDNENGETLRMMGDYSDVTKQNRNITGTETAATEKS